MKEKEGNQKDVKEAFEDFSKEDVWNNIGFHRPVAGFFYNLPFTFISMAVGIAMSSWVYGFLYPFPESMGYRSAVLTLFSLFFQSFDLGTANMMNRFIGETNVNNPRKMLYYIQYFCWYQMITGLIQVTTIAIYALYFVPEEEMAYAVWIMLVNSITQYPGMLHIFKSVLSTLQQYNKTAILGFIQGQMIQRLTEIAFVIWGKYYGQANPEIGEIMGIAIGATIGLYVDDFIAMVMAGFFFSKVMNNYGITVRDCFGHDFDKDILKECLSWGVKSGLPPMAWTIVSFVELKLWLEFVPQYTTFLALFNFANGIAGVSSWYIGVGGGFSEAYNNGKLNLTQYYLAQSWKYAGILQFLMISALLVIILILEPTFILLGISQYSLAIPFIIPAIIREFQQPYNNFSSNVIISTGHVNFLALCQLLEAALAIISWYIYIPVLRLPDRFGPTAIVWLIPCGELFSILFKIIINYIYINKKIMKVKIPIHQTFVAPIISTAFIYVMGRLYVQFIFFPMDSAYGTLPALILMAIIFILIVPFFVYMPLTALFGSWDEGSVNIMRKAVKISGMGRVFVYPMFKSIEWTMKRSKLAKKYAFDDSEAVKEARELMKIKNFNMEKHLKII